MRFRIDWVSGEFGHDSGCAGIQDMRAIRLPALSVAAGGVILPHQYCW